MLTRTPVVRGAAAAALAVLPFLAVNWGQIALTEGSYLHFSRTEAALLTVMLAILLWLAAAATLASCAAMTRNAPRMFAVVAVAATAGLTAIVAPRSWAHLLDIRNGGFGEWLFRVGVLAIVSYLILERRAARRDSLTGRADRARR